MLWGNTSDQKEPGTKRADHNTDAINAEKVLDITYIYVIFMVLQCINK